MKESNLSANNKRGKRAPSLPPPEEICIIEDAYQDPSKVHEDEIPAKVRNESLRNSTKSKRVDGSM